MAIAASLQGRCANIRQRSEAKHCSSLCSQSEGANIMATKHELKIQQGHAPKRRPCSLRVRGPHFASKVSYNAGAATDDCAGQRKSPLRGRCCQYLIFYLDHPKVMRRPSGIIKSSLRLLQVIDLRPRVALPSAASRATSGREPCYLRPRAALPSAASRATFGREPCYLRPRVDDL